MSPIAQLGGDAPACGKSAVMSQPSIIDFPREQPIRGGHVSQVQQGHGGRSTSRKETHIGVLSVHASCTDNPGLLLVLVEHEGVGIDVPLDDFETGLVRDSVAVAEG